MNRSGVDVHFVLRMTHIPRAPGEPPIHLLSQQANHPLPGSTTGEPPSHSPGGFDGAPVSGPLEEAAPLLQLEHTKPALVISPSWHSDLHFTQGEDDMKEGMSSWHEGAPPSKSPGRNSGTANVDFQKSSVVGLACH